MPEQSLAGKYNVLIKKSRRLGQDWVFSTETNDLCVKTGFPSEKARILCQSKVFRKYNKKHICVEDKFLVKNTNLIPTKFLN